MAVADKMIRKQFTLSPATAKRLARIAALRDTSASEVVRQAIDAYETEVGQGDARALLDVVAARLKEAIQSTREVTQAVECSIQRLSDDPA